MTSGSVTVTRSGGFAGIEKSGSLDLDDDHPRAREAAELLDRVDFDALTTSPPGPDRFVFRIETPGRKVVVGEADLTPDLKRLTGLVLSD